MVQKSMGMGSYPCLEEYKHGAKQMRASRVAWFVSVRIFLHMGYLSRAAKCYGAMWPCHCLGVVEVIQSIAGWVQGWVGLMLIWALVL